VCTRCSVYLCCKQGRSQTFSFGGATGGASFATRGAVNGLCRTFRKRPTERDLILGEPLGGPGKIFGRKWPPCHPPISAPGAEAINRECFYSHKKHGPPLNAAFSKWPLSSKINCPPLQYAVQQQRGFGTSCI